MKYYVIEWEGVDVDETVRTAAAVLEPLCGKIPGNGGGCPGETGCGGRVDPCCMIHKISRETRICLYLLICQISGQLMHDGRYHFQMAQFFCACRGGAMEERVQNPCAARICGVEQCQNTECAKTGVAV